MNKVQTIKKQNRSVPRETDTATEISSLSAHLELVQQIQGLSPDLINLTTEEAAVFLRCSNKGLEQKRVSGGGPTYSKNTHLVTYNLATLMDYRDSNQRNNTLKVQATIGGGDLANSKISEDLKNGNS